VAGHPYRGYIRSIAAAFESHGLSTDILEWPVLEYNPLDAMMYGISQGAQMHQDETQQRLNSQAFERQMTKAAPDYALIMNGVRISQETRRLCHEAGTKLALWAYDTPVRLPWIMESLDSYDLVYTYEPEDLTALSRNAQASFLPLAYDHRVYQPFSRERMFQTDLCFVGTVIRKWPERMERLRRLSKYLSNRKIEIWTDSIHLWSPRGVVDILTIGGGKDRKVRRREADHTEINELYNRTKVCLNIHMPDQRKAVNPRTFEILGSGGFLLTDRLMTNIPDFEEGRDYVIYSNIDDLLEKADEFISADDRRVEIAEHGHFLAGKSHTYVRRAERVLRDLRNTD